MAETNNPSGGESTTNTTTGTTGGRGAGTAGGGATGGTGNTLSNTATVTQGGTGGGSNLSSANTPDANLENEQTASAPKSDVMALPFPHNALAGLEVEGSAYRDLIKDVYKEHEKALESDKGNVYEPSPEMIAARDDAQVSLANELRASLKAQRSMRRVGAEEAEGNVKIKLTHPHIHGGVAYEAGDEISVDEASAKFIEEAKAGKKV